MPTKLKTVNFILYVSFKTFKSYSAALCFLSLIIIISLTSLFKYLIIKLKPEWLNDLSLKSFFQLSYFGFIPVFVLLIYKKYKKEFLEGDSYSEMNIKPILSLLTTIFISLTLVVLFTFLIVA